MLCLPGDTVPSVGKLELLHSWGEEAVGPAGEGGQVPFAQLRCALPWRELMGAPGKAEGG